MEQWTPIRVRIHQGEKNSQILEETGIHWKILEKFLTHPEVPASNNHGEREVRSAVLIRKIRYGNRSDQNALDQGVFISIFRTLKRRGYNPIATLVAALREFIRTGHMPPFPPLISEG